MRYKGTVVKGYQIASGNSSYDKRFSTVGSIKLQKPFFKSVKGLDKIYEGTINIKLDSDFIMPKKFDYSFTDIPWHKDFIESFNFLKCEILHKNKTYSGYVYFPSKTPHKTIIEVISPKIDGLKYGDVIEIIT